MLHTPEVHPGQLKDCIMSFVDDFASDRNAKIQWQGATGTVQFGNPDNLVVMFYNRSTLDQAQSTERGHPVHKDVLYVRYHPPGERLNINDRPARGEDQHRWPLQWQQFSRQLNQRPDGMPVGLLYPTKPAIAATLQACGVFTVEQLAQLSAHAIEQVGMGAQSWVNDAQRYLEAANKGVKASQLKAELDERDSRIRTLEMKLERATAEISRMREGNPAPTDQRGIIQQMVADAMAAQGAARPTIPPNPQAGFDAQTAQINATAERGAPRPRRNRKGA
jgi:hypothetical protein